MRRQESDDVIWLTMLTPRACLWSAVTTGECRRYGDNGVLDTYSLQIYNVAMKQGSLKSPLEGYENAEPLPNTINPDGKSLYNPPAPDRKLSSSYTEFPPPIDSSNNGFDFHIYYMQSVPEEMQYAKELHERIRREFPELRIYKFWDKPVGPHPVAMFEVNTFTPHQTGAFFSWLTVWRGPCSVLIHPNTDSPYKDHTELMSWMGRPWPLYTEPLKKMAGRGTVGRLESVQSSVANGAAR